MHWNKLTTLVTFYVIYFSWYVECIMFHLPPNSQKCLREELRQNVLMTGDYHVSDALGQRVDYVVSLHAPLSYLFPFLNVE